MLEFDADLLQFAAVWRRMNRAYLSPNRRRLGLYVQAHDLQRDPGSDDIVVAGRIAAAVQIHAGGNGSLDKRLAHATFAEDDSGTQRSRRVLRRDSSLTRLSGVLAREDWLTSSPWKCILNFPWCSERLISPGKFRRSRILRR